MENEIMHDRQFELDNEIALQKQIEIEELLQEADRWGLRGEVEMYAQKNLEETPTMEILDAYYNAFNDWIK